MTKRKQIREAIVAILNSYTPLNGVSKFENRSESYFKQELPSISVVTEKEDFQVLDVTSSKYKSKLEWSLQITADAKENLDDILDDLGQKCWDALKTNLSLNGHVLSTELVGADMELSTDGRDVVGVLNMRFVSKYIF
jgi:hypothetical protein